MRILQVRFKNLNSLVGEWLIDFTHPAYSSDGLFAITGPTGAGKSSILDAICLALYGQTPRLNKFSKSSNEVMSRQAGECFAEVSFETAAGQYRCHWSQNRARKKSTGELQNPKHEISDVKTGQVLETKLRLVAKKIEQTTGMDFERFTRSMLLAQGGFDAFLHASASDRAPILEQLTGTEIYSQISIAVHEEKTEQQKILSLLEAELAGMKLLDIEEEQQLEEDLISQKLDDANTSAELDRQSKALHWLKNISQLQQEIDTLSQQNIEHQAEQHAFEPNRQKLARAQQALELSAQYTELKSLRQEQLLIQKTLDASKRQLPEQTTNKDQCQSELSQATITLNGIKAEQLRSLPTIKKVRELDLLISEKQKNNQSATTNLNTIEYEQDKFKHRLTDTNTLLNQHQQKLTSVLTSLEQHKIDEHLIESFSAIKDKFNHLHLIHKKQNDNQAKIELAHKDQISSQATWQDLLATLKIEENELQIKQKQLTNEQDKLAELLQGKTATQWRLDLSTLRQKKADVDKLHDTNLSLSSLKTKLNDCKARHAGKGTERETIKQALDSEQEKHKGLEREVKLHETQLSLASTMKSYEEARQVLNDGCECPLCGSTEHPFAHSELPNFDTARSDLDIARQAAKQSDQRLSDYKISLANMTKDIEHIAGEQIATAKRMDIDQEFIDENLSLLDPFDWANDLNGAISQALFDTEQQIEQTTAIVNTIDDLELTQRKLSHAVDQQKDRRNQLSEKTQAAEHQAKLDQHSYQQAVQEQSSLSNDYNNALAAALSDVTPLGISELPAESVEQTLHSLAKRRQHYVDFKTAKDALDKQCAELRLQAQYQADELTRLDSEIKKSEQVNSELLNEINDLSQERADLFGERQADLEETRLSQHLAHAEASFNHARQNCHSAEQSLQSLLDAIQASKKNIQSRSAQLEQANTEFSSRGHALGFADESNYLAACMPEQERSRLQQHAQKLDTQTLSLSARLGEKHELIASEKDKKLTQNSLETLTNKVSELTQQSKSLQQSLWKTQQQLANNDALRLSQADHINAIDAQQRECNRWGILHELIGSADGKKFRNFAQGLTFEMMISHANQQLQKMTDRYLLIRDKDQPLELNVMDSFQAGEIRSTKNLSGGESFIVSLALALGLSQMASNKVRVDSLFLDEGFGTLDEDALDMALETLSGLQQEGKLIGIISHVTSLKERISSQIQVSPIAGGKSTISGPGCTAL